MWGEKLIIWFWVGLFFLLCACLVWEVCVVLLMLVGCVFVFDVWMMDEGVGDGISCLWFYLVGWLVGWLSTLSLSLIFIFIFIYNLM